jgi:phosphate-selective porin OprO and OprP
MRLTRSAAALIAAGLLWLPSAPLLAQSNSDEDLRAQIRELREKLERLEQKLERQPQQTAPIPAAPPAALQQRVEDLDQQVRILNRKQELQREELAAKEKESPVVSSVGERGVSFRSADGRNEVRLRGVFQADERFFLGDSLGTDTFVLRKVRPIIEGTVADIYDFRIMPDFGNGKAVLQDAYAAARFAPWAKVTVGKMKQPIGLERLQQDVDTRFVERAFPTDIAPNRDVGVDLHGDLLRNTLEYDVGYFHGVADGGSSDAFNAEQDNNSDKDWAARLFARPFRNSPGLFQGLGFGAAVNYANLGGSSPGAGATATVQTTNLPTYPTPAQQTFFTYRTTGANATFALGERLRFSPQAYWYWGPFGAMAEYIVVQQDVARTLANNTTRRSRLSNNAWQVQLSYMLTGEDETFGSIKPSRPFELGKDGWGAWEAVGRYSALNVDDAAFAGGANSYADPAVSASSAKEWSVGLNWYANWYVKLQLEYSRTKFHWGAGTTAAPLDRPDEQLIFGRVQLAF